MLVSWYTPFVLPPPHTHSTTQIPRICAKISDDFKGKDLNAFSAFSLAKELKERIRLMEKGPDGSVDVLLTGCEVSLWLAEQFSADLSAAFPKLIIQTMSANKVLGLWGQEFSIPQTGYQFHEDSWNLNKTIVIIVSHSGGTFSSLAVSNLLQAYTENIWDVASEWDTQIGKQLRSLSTHDKDLKSRIFSTNIGIRPAEPCTLSVIATQQLLTEILLYLMVQVEKHGLKETAGGVYNHADINAMKECNKAHISALEQITGTTRGGYARESDANLEIKDRGLYWSQHVLETPIAWMMVFTYVMVTVIAGAPLVTGIANNWLPDGHEAYWPLKVADGLIYVFSPQLCMLLLRCIQGRPLIHRLTGRTVVIGDVPWVCQVRSSCGVVRCGAVWCGAVWCGVVWCGVVWCGVVWCGVVW